MSEQTDNEYFVGLWREHAIEGLSWYQSLAAKGADDVLFNQNRTCPSWSWAGVDGPLFFSVGENVTATVEDIIITKNEIRGVAPHAANLVVEGEITLQAPISSLQPYETLGEFAFFKETSIPQAFCNILYIDDGLSNPGVNVSVIVTQPTITLPDGLRFLELSRGKWDGSQNFAMESRGLLIVPVEGKEKTYRRAGFFVVALEYDVDMAASGQNPTFYMTVEQRNVRPTAFGETWIKSLEVDTVTLV